MPARDKTNRLLLHPNPVRCQCAASALPVRCCTFSAYTCTALPVRFHFARLARCLLREWIFPGLVLPNETFLEEEGKDGEDGKEEGKKEGKEEGEDATRSGQKSSGVSQTCSKSSRSKSSKGKSMPPLRAPGSQSFLPRLLPAFFPRYFAHSRSWTRRLH